ncbi:MAG: FKBP-type peptidyl-prolyl cis-trans isomerase [Tannerella sp.]|nr:FKBP-type peptidyl-prolyl cis-trans isomerase [Tannerella sp.]
MKKYSLWLVAAVAVTLIASCRTSKNAADTVSTATPPHASYVPATDVDTVCYAIGVNFGNGLRESMNNFPGGETNMKALKEGFLHAINSDTAQVMTAEAAQAYIQSFMMAIQQKDAAAEKEKGDRFLAEHRTAEGVITTESGLQYRILKQGDGAKPTAENQVQVHYTGKLLDGTVFDSSVERGEPATIPLTGVIAGWTELLQLMPVGSKYQVWIPSELGYGPQGSGQTIKPNSVLEFEVELLGIESGE